MATLQFLGAAETVTGSRFLLQAAGRKILIDCGLFQGGRELRERNWSPLPVSASELDAIVITHAHIDHTGYLPRIVKEGYKGPIYCTPATADLLGLLLPDSGHLQEEDAEYANRKSYSRHKPALPLYTEQEARHSLSFLQKVPYHSPRELAPGLEFTYHTAGHILGSAMIAMTCPTGKASLRLLFTGDLGRNQQPIIKDPETIDEADVLVMESTYGDRVHNHLSVPGFLEELIKKTVSSGGSLVIPAFAIGRSQRLMYILRELETAHRIPRLPIYLDSPMAVSAVSIYCKHLEEHDLEMHELMGKACPLTAGTIHLVHSVEESKALNEIRQPCIILSASGNLSGGRILHHLKHRIADSRNTVLFVGFQPEGSLGRYILQGARVIKIHGDRIPVRARIESLDALSAHADSQEILQWVASFGRPPSRVFLVHGEPAAQKALKEKLSALIHSEIAIPHYLESVEL